MSRSSAFTLIELLIVISILIILMGLLFPAANAVIDTARKVQAKNDAVQIVSACIAYEAEYGKMLTTNVAAQQIGGDLLSALIGADTNLNPRQFVFLEIPTAKKGKSGISNNIFYDPWGGAYYAAFDHDYDNQVSVSTNGGTTGETNIRAKVGAWNQNTNSRQQVRSWE